jgi:hypothetical protein
MAGVITIVLAVLYQLPIAHSLELLEHLINVAAPLEGSMWIPETHVAVSLELGTQSADPETLRVANMIKQDVHAFDLCYKAGGSSNNVHNREIFCGPLTSGRELPHVLLPPYPGFYSSKHGIHDFGDSDFSLDNYQNISCDPGIEFWFQRRDEVPTIQYAKVCRELRTKPRWTPLNYHNIFECVNDVTNNQLPKDAAGKLFIHHAFTKIGKYNFDERFLPFQTYHGSGPKKMTTISTSTSPSGGGGVVTKTTTTTSIVSAPCTVWYVGGHRDGGDGQHIQQLYKCHIDVFEPIIEFFNDLKELWKDIPRSKLHPFGLGQHTREITGISLDEEATFAMSADEKQKSLNSASFQAPGTTSVQIKSVAEFWDGYFGNAPSSSSSSSSCPTGPGDKSLNHGFVSVLHMNCEGCEYEVMEAIISANLSQYFGLIQFETHYAAEQVPNLVERLCKIDQALSFTHDKVFQQYFGWSRWVLKP